MYSTQKICGLYYKKTELQLSQFRVPLNKSVPFPPLKPIYELSKGHAHITSKKICMILTLKTNRKLLNISSLKSKKSFQYRKTTELCSKKRFFKYLKKIAEDI